MRFLGAKYAKNAFTARSAPDPAEAACSAPPDPLALFNVPTFKGSEGHGTDGEEREKAKEGAGGEKGEECRGGEGKGKSHTATSFSTASSPGDGRSSSGAAHRPAAQP